MAGRGLLVVLFVAQLAASPLGQSREFDVASIKRNTATLPMSSGAMQGGPPNDVRMVWVPMRLVILRAYPLALTPVEIVNLPSWADTERYDVVVKADQPASAEEMQAMWRALLADRLKLTAHYETRVRRVYNLVRARQDGRLGPQLSPSPLNCAPRQPGERLEPPTPDMQAAMRPGALVSSATESQLMSRCHQMFNVGDTTYAGGIPPEGLLQALRPGSQTDRPVIDRTGLTGYYAMKLTFWRNQAIPPGPDDAPLLVTAIQEQLGLKLEPAEEPSQVLVIDTIERPSEN